MSDQNTQPTLPPVDVSTDVIFRKVHADAYLSKMAELGFVAQTEKQALYLLDIGTQLAGVEDEPVKEASAVDIYEAASHDLARTLQQAGMGGHQKSSVDRQTLEQAYAYASDPDVYLAALAIKTAEAEAMANGQ